MAKTINFYSIRTLTNLHVGSGDNNYGVVDNLVQRDLNTGLPTIHSSSLKGALREFFRGQESSLKPIFGADPREETRTEGQRTGEAGEWQFLSADLLSRPLRSDIWPYFHATSPEVIAQLVGKFENMGLPVPEGLRQLASLDPEPGRPIVFDSRQDKAILEDLVWNASYENLVLSDWVKTVFGARLALVNDRDFRDIELPVIARNYLESGESKNLWYEEVVPYDARFGVFLVQTEPYIESFEAALSEENVQIGANASVGYGLCKLTNQSSQPATAAL